MARTPSNMLPLGTKAPDFKLLNVNFHSYYCLDICMQSSLLANLLTYMLYKVL